MALIECSDCSKSISDKAAACPHCGRPNERRATVAKPAPPTAQASASPTQEELVSAGIRARRPFWGPWWALALCVVWVVAGSQIFKGALDQYRLTEVFHRSNEGDELILFGIAWACFVLPIGLWRAANHKWG